jgi:hypothetical protein
MRHVILSGQGGQLTDHDGADGHAASGNAHRTAVLCQDRLGASSTRATQEEAEAHILQEQGAVEDALARVPRLFHVASRSESKSRHNTEA